MKYRILTIMPLFYRRWAAMRHHSLAQWIKSWDTDEIHAGTSANGAEDAWWRTNIEHELARLCGKDIMGGSADIFKCFDQVSRKLLEKLLVESGCPHRIVEPYMRYLEEAVIYNSVAGLWANHTKEHAASPKDARFQ